MSVKQGTSNKRQNTLLRKPRRTHQQLDSELMLGSKIGPLEEPSSRAGIGSRGRYCPGKVPIRFKWLGLPGVQENLEVCFI